jgi:hypothetical protein
MATYQHAPSDYQASPERPRSILGPTILIGLGLLFLAQNFGWISGDFWLNIWRFWPVLLVAAGIELILGRSNWGSAIAVLVLVLAVGAIVAWSVWLGPRVFRGDGVWAGGAAGVAATERLVEEIGNARQATITLNHGAGRLIVGALPTTSPSLLEADLAHGENTTIERQINRSNDQVQVSLRGRTVGSRIFGGDPLRDNWTLNLSPQAATDLRVTTGASDLNLNLRDLKVTRLDVNAGASSVNIVLPAAAGHTDAVIQAGMASVDVTVPEGVAARIRVRQGISGSNVDATRFPRVGEYYQSPGYETAANRVNLNVETGISSLNVR